MLYVNKVKYDSLLSPLVDAAFYPCMKWEINSLVVFSISLLFPPALAFHAISD